jgi:hypothetical protein
LTQAVRSRPTLFTAAPSTTLHVILPPVSLECCCRWHDNLDVCASGLAGKGGIASWPSQKALLFSNAATTTARVNITLKISPGTSYSSQIVVRGAKLFRPLHSARSNQHQQCERLKKHVFSLRMCDYKTTAKHGLSRNSSLALGVTVTSSWRASGEKNLHASFTSTTPAPSRSVASPRRTCSRCVKIGVDSSSVYV